MEYYNTTKSYKQYGFIGDDLSELEIAIFVDADWASDRSDYKSTTGGLLVILGANSFFPLAFLSQKQGCTSASTPEAEVVALMQMVKNLGIPSMDFMDLVFGRKTQIKCYEDNEATQKILKNGKFEKALGHVNRTHGITLSWLTDVLAQKKTYCDSRLSY